MLGVSFRQHLALFPSFFRPLAIAPHNSKHAETLFESRSRSSSTMYSTRSTVAATETSSDSLAHSTTGVRSIGALLVSDEHTQALPTGFQIFPSHHAVTAAKIVRVQLATW